MPSGRSACQTMKSSCLRSSKLFVAVWLMAMRSRLVSSASVGSSSRVRLAPRMSGLRAMDHRVISVRCSSGVRCEDARLALSRGQGGARRSEACRRRASCRALRTAPTRRVERTGPSLLGEMSCPARTDQTSHSSSAMRHMLASRATSAACASAVGPGERLSTIGPASLLDRAANHLDLIELVRDDRRCSRP